MSTTTQAAQEATTLLAWRAATSDVRKALGQDAFDKHYAAIKADRDKRGVKAGMTHAQVEKATRLAKMDVTQALYKMAECNGVRNPVHDDPEWAPNRTKSATPKADNFKANKYAGRCPKCNGWVEAQAGKLVKVQGKWGAEHLTCPEAKEEQAPEAPKDGIDLSGLVAGYYAVPDGDTRLKLAISHGNGKWDGWHFVKDAAEYGQQERYGMQRPGQSYSGKVEDALRAILADPKAAMIAYGKLVGRCGACGRQLEDEASVAAGIGPICAAKF